MVNDGYYDFLVWTGSEWAWENKRPRPEGVDLSLVPKPIRNKGETIRFLVRTGKGVMEAKRTVEGIKHSLYIKIGNEDKLDQYYDSRAIHYKTELYGHTSYIGEYYIAK